MSTHDVYAYGVVSSSTLYSTRGMFPEAEGYAEIDEVQHMVGGEAANSSIVLSRLGARVKLDGNWIGADDSGKRTKAFLNDNQIDTSRLSLKEGYIGVQEVVVAAQATRTIFGTYGRLLDEENWNAPQEDDVVQAKVVCLDPFFKEASRRVAEIGHDANVPVVAVDCLYDDPLLKHLSAVVVSEPYIRGKYKDRQVRDLFQDYQGATSGLVVFTFGDRPIWYARPGEEAKTFQPYAIDPVDTAGAGDSFRAGIVYGFLQGWDDRKTIEFAAAVAAIVCIRSPGVLGAPNYDEVLDFKRLRQSSRSANGISQQSTTS